MRVAQRKNRVRSSGFSPSLPYAAWKNQMLASIPMRNPLLPSGFASKPSTTDKWVKERVWPAGRIIYRISLTHMKHIYRYWHLRPIDQRHPCSVEELSYNLPRGPFLATHVQTAIRSNFNCIVRKCTRTLSILFHSRLVASGPSIFRSCKAVLQDIKGEWKKLGAGSFGNVYKGTISTLSFIHSLISHISIRDIPWY